MDSVYMYDLDGSLVEVSCNKFIYSPNRLRPSRINNKRQAGHPATNKKQKSSSSCHPLRYKLNYT